MNRDKILRTGLYLLLVLLALTYGVLIGKYEFPPYSILKSGYRYTRMVLNPQTEIPAKPTEKPPEPTDIPLEFIEIQEEYYKTDVLALISINDPDDVSEKRVELIKILWGLEEVPSYLPSTIINDWQDDRYDDLQSIHRIDKLVITMEFGLDSNVYHFIPQNPNNKVVLFHQGHHGDFIESKEQIRQLLDDGYAVTAFCMPLLGLNSKPTVEIPHIGHLRISSHDHMKFLFPEKGHSIKFFIEPVITVLNYLEKEFEYRSTSMIGISGGGWTTTLAAAIDTRISYSFPVAGSFPIYLLSDSKRDWGDFEQTNPELYKNVNYLELYVLGGYGNNRKQLQVINQFDDCCFAGIKWQTYKDIVSTHVQQLGAGEFDLFLDDSHQEHLISSIVMDRILLELENN